MDTGFNTIHNYCQGNIQYYNIPVYSVGHGKKWGHEVDTTSGVVNESMNTLITVFLGIFH